MCSPGNIRLDEAVARHGTAPPKLPPPHTLHARNPMMMAHDSSSTPPAALDAVTLDAVRTAIVAYLDAPAAHSERLRNALTDMAGQARDRAILPEQLLVTLKDIWYGLPTVKHVAEPRDQVQTLQRIVTMCIKEYYGD